MEDEESSEGYMFTPEQGGGTGKRRRTNSKDDGVGAETKNKAAAMLGEHEPRPDPTSRKASRSRSRERQRDRSARDRRDKNDDRRQDNRSRRGPALRDRPRDNSRKRDRRERDRRRDHEQHRSGERAGAGSRRVYNNNSDSGAELVFLDERGVRRREKEGDASRREPSRGGAFSSHQPGHGSRSAAAVNGPPPHRDGVAASGADSSSLGAGTGRKIGTAPAGIASSHESQSHANGAAAAAGATTTTAAGQPLQANGDHAGNLNTSANLVVPAPIASAGAASDLAVSTANGGIASSSAAPAAGPLLRSPEEKDEQEDDNHNVEHGEQRQVVPASSSSSSKKLPPPSEYYGRQEWLESKRFYKYRKCKLQFQAKHANNGAPQVHGGFLRDSQFAVVDLELVEKEERDRRSSLVVQTDAVHPELAAGHHDLLYARKIASWDVKYEKLPKSAADQTIEPVGQGAYGKVYKAKNRLTGELVAAKVTTKLADEEGGANLSFMREVQTMRRLVDCSACVRLVEMAVTDRGEPVIVMEYCHASLSQLLQSEKHSLTMANIKYLMQQVLEGVGYMHALGILHRDLATKNVLFNISGEIKVCDFGLSRVAFGGEERAKNLEPPQFIVTILYRSIELLLGEQNYGPALDIWGVGCILAEILIFKGGVSKKPFFYDESLGNNVNEMTVAAYVFQLLGRPTQKSWPDFPKLLKRCNFENFEAHIRNARPHKEHLVLREDPDSCTTSSSKATSTAGAGGALALSGGAAKKGGGPTTSNFFSNEALNLKELFTTGGCKQVRAQLFIKESLFHLLGGMLNLDPAFRFTARKSLEDSWFGENPVPTWDAGRFANQVDVVTGAADTTREEKERRALVRMLEEAESTRATVVDSRELQGPPGAGRAGGSKAKPSIKTAPPGGGAFGSGIPGGGRRNSEGGAAGGAVSADERYVSRTGKRLPGNWERMWSRTNKKVFYANTKTRATQWHTPTK